VRVLFSSIGAVGHVNPMVPLAQAVASAGNEVRWACAADVCPMIEKAGLSTVPAGMTMSARQARRDQRIAEFATLAPAVAYLCHESCAVTGEVLSALAGRVARAFVAEIVGYFNEALTVEDVASNLDTIFGPEGYISMLGPQRRRPRCSPS